MKSKMPPKKLYGRDDFQTPHYAVIPLLEYLPQNKVVWECANGIGNITAVLRKYGWEVVATDITDGKDFFVYEPESYDIIITNPPYSEKDMWLKRCYQLRKPFALLLPLTALEGNRRHKMYREYGLQIILLDKRIDFVLPLNKAPEKSSSWFASGWFTWGLNLPKDLIFERINKNFNLVQGTLL